MESFGSTVKIKASVGVKDIIDIPQLAVELRKSQRWAYERARRGELPGARKIGGCWFVARQAILDHLLGKDDRERSALNTPREK
jgi:hypothetical protein